MFNKQKFKLFSEFVGPKVMRVIYGAIAVGVFLFIVESSFVFIIQGFLLAVGIAPSTTMMLPSWYPRTVLASLMILTLFGLLRSLGYFLKHYFTQMAYHTYIRNKRSQIVNYSLEHALELSTSEVVDMFSETIVRSANAVHAVASLFLVTTTAILLFLFGFKIAPLEMLLSIGFLALLAFPIRKLEKNVSVAAEGLRSEWVQVNSTLLNGIKNNFFLKIYGLVGEEEKKANNNLSRYFQHIKNYTFTYALKLALPPAIGVVVISVITYLSVHYIKTPGIILLSFFYIFMRFVQSSSEVLSGLGEVKLLLTNIKILYHWENKLAYLSQSRAQKRAKHADGNEFSKKVHLEGVNISGKDVSFQFEENSKWIIKNLNFNLSKGKCLVISGESGAGKSTLLSLLLGVNSVSSGSITANGYEIEKVRGELFNCIGYVGPEPYLIAGTVRENLLYGHPNSKQVGNEEITDCLKKANAYDFVMKLPNKVDTFLNEFAKISTGQKQRIAIARVLLRNPLLLVTDECTSNLDSFNEAEIVNALSKLKGKITMIVVTHRQAFKSIADHCIELSANEDLAQV